MRARVTATVRRIQPETSQAERDALLTAHGLDLGMPKQASALVALLGPLLAGIPGTALVKLLD
jgi:hypothetical protein